MFCFGHLKDNGRMDRASAKLLEEKIICVLKETEMSTVILGAWGCGVYGCPPKHVAEIFRDTIAK